MKYIRSKSLGSRLVPSLPSHSQLEHSGASLLLSASRTTKSPRPQSLDSGFGSEIFSSSSAASSVPDENRLSDVVLQDVITQLEDRFSSKCIPLVNAIIEDCNFKTLLENKLSEASEFSDSNVDTPKRVKYDLNSGPAYICAKCLISFDCFEDVESHEEQEHSVNVVELKDPMDLSSKELLTKDSFFLEELPSQEMFAKELPSHDLSSKWTALKELPSQEMFTMELPSQNLPSNASAFKELASKELPSKELFYKKLASKEFASRKFSYQRLSLLKKFPSKTSPSKENSSFRKNSYLFEKLSLKEFNSNGISLRKELSSKKCSSMLLKNSSLLNKSAIYKCDQCPRSYTYYENFQNHLAKVHTIPKHPQSFPCTRCDRVFSLKANLKVHAREVHSNIRAFRCKGHCGATFKRKEHLEQHVLFVNGIKPYRCIWKDPGTKMACDYVSTYLSDVTKHVRGIHLKLPLTKRRQAELNIIDHRKSSDYIVYERPDFSLLNGYH